jgi:glycosyltransferase involved in cell wall biosynthesis
MRIANIIEEGKVGGPQVRIISVAAALKGSVETIVVMPSENSSDFRQRCVEAGVTYHTLSLSRITKEWKGAICYLLFSLVEIIRLVVFLKRSETDLVHVSGGSWQYKGVLAGKMAGKKVVWHLNDTCMPLFVRKLFSYFSCLSDGFIFASERSKSYYQPLMKSDKPEFVIPAPVDTTKFDPTNSFKGDESIIANWSDKIVVGIVANINPIKGLEVFIKAAALTNRQTTNVHFAVLGPIYENQKRYFNELELLCEKLSVSNIEFLGGRSDVRPLLKRFDIYVCSSLAESSPISVWEAMAMGTPVISTDVGDVPLYVRDEDNGFIVNVEDSEALSERLKLLISNSELRHQFGARGREVVVSELGLGRCAARHLNAYKNILE